MHSHRMHAHEMPAREIHAREMHARDTTPITKMDKPSGPDLAGLSCWDWCGTERFSGNTFDQHLLLLIGQDSNPS